MYRIGEDINREDIPWIIPHPTLDDINKYVLRKAQYEDMERRKEQEDRDREYYENVKIAKREREAKDGELYKKVKHDLHKTKYYILGCAKCGGRANLTYSFGKIVTRKYIPDGSNKFPCVLQCIGLNSISVSLYCSACNCNASEIYPTPENAVNVWNQIMKYNYELLGGKDVYENAGLIKAFRKRNTL